MFNSLIELAGKEGKNGLSVLSNSVHLIQYQEVSCHTQNHFNKIKVSLFTEYQLMAYCWHECRGNI